MIYALCIAVGLVMGYIIGWIRAMYYCHKTLKEEMWKRNVGA